MGGEQFINHRGQRGTIRQPTPRPVTLGNDLDRREPEKAGLVAATGDVGQKESFYAAAATWVRYHS